MVAKSPIPDRVIGVESSDGPAMKASIDAGRVETIEWHDHDVCRVRRVGDITLRRAAVRHEIVTLPDRDIFDAMIWVMERCKLVVEGRPRRRRSPRCCTVW